MKRQSARWRPMMSKQGVVGWNLILLSLAAALVATPAEGSHADIGVTPPETIRGASQQEVVIDLQLTNPAGSPDEPGHGIDEVVFSVPGSGGTLEWRQAFSSSEDADGVPWTVEADNSGSENTLAFSATGAQAWPADSTQLFTISFNIIGQPAHASTIVVDILGTTLDSLPMEGRFDVEIDAEAPSVVQALTEDGDGDGRPDRYNITFSEPVVDSRLDFSHWHVDGTSVLAIDSGQSDDEQMWLRFDEEAEAKSDWTPPLTYSGDSIVDALENVRSDVQDGDVVEQDGVSPVLVGLVTQDLDLDGSLDALHLEWSEPVPEPPSNFQTSRWTIDPESYGTEDNGHPVSLGLVEPGDERRWRLLLREQTGAGTNDGDVEPTLTYDAAALQDAAGNRVEPFQIKSTDGIAPDLAWAKTLDSDQDGHVDAYMLNFSEPMQNPDLDVTGWTVEGRTGLAFASESGANLDRQWVLGFDPSPLPDTDAVPDLSYVTPSGVRDGAGNLLGNVSSEAIQELDGAHPVLLRADGIKFQREVVLWFSEPVRGRGGGDALVLDDLLYDDDDPDTGRATHLVEVERASDVERVVAETNKNLREADLGRDKVGPNETVADAAGNIAVQSFQAIREDAVEPSPVDDLRATGLTRHSIRLDWNTSNDFDLRELHIRFNASRIHNETTWQDARNWTLGVPDPLPGQSQSVVVSGLEPKTQYHFALRGIDDAGHVAGLSNEAVATTPEDTSPPTGELVLSSPTHPDPTRAYDDNMPRVAWTALSDDDSEVSYYYAFTRSADHNVTLEDNRTGSTSALPFEPLADGTWYFHVAGASGGGLAGAQASFVIQVDTTHPAQVTDLAATATNANTITLTWSAPGDDNAVGRAAAYDVRIATSVITVESWNNSAKARSQAPGSAGTAETLAITALQPTTRYHVSVRAVDDAGNLGPISNIATITTPDDQTPPTGVLEVSSQTHPRGKESPFTSALFSFSGVRDPESTIAYHYVLSKRPDDLVDARANWTPEVNLSLEIPGRGAWFLHVRAISGGGASEVVTHGFTVVRIDPEDIRATNEAIDVEARHRPGENMVRWTLPDDPPAAYRGVQVWRLQGLHYMLLADLPVGSDGYEQATYKDAGPRATEGAAYLVTAYYGDASELGHFAGTLGDSPAGNAYTAAYATTGGGWLAAAWPYLVGLVVAALVVVSIILSRRRRS